MKLLRLMFSLVLMLAIPFLGASALAMPQIPPCPMQSDMTHSMGMQADHDDCCQIDKVGSQESSKAKSSTPCKPGQECKLGQVFSPVLALLEFQPLPASAVVTIYSDTAIHSHDPSGLWRPPQL
ncbi:hypothetical protein PQU96_13115 [Vogesella sp. LYT5W]|uniref:Uncharacterized protein n=1 Tax=Vogesella margarita TaxID=2984199 RepID=A0ABT5ITV9_9NEIS|nr:hypothetical protein [Vogesella margarita]MDC7715054.1 hypothetical protein [Vogesella margarita]